MRKASIIASLLMILLSIGIFAETAGYRRADAAISEGPGFYPQLLAGALIVLSLLIIFNTLRNKEDINVTFINRRVLNGIVLIIVYCIIFKFFGFVLSSIIIMIFLIRVMGGAGWKTITISSVIIPVGIYLVFNNLLQVPLPWGLFENFM